MGLWCCLLGLQGLGMVFQVGSPSFFYMHITGQSLLLTLHWCSDVTCTKQESLPHISEEGAAVSG